MRVMINWVMLAVSVPFFIACWVWDLVTVWFSENLKLFNKGGAMAYHGSKKPAKKKTSKKATAKKTMKKKTVAKKTARKRSKKA